MTKPLRAFSEDLGSAFDGMRARLAHQRGRALLSAAGIALGVALGFAVHLVNGAALNEFSLAVRTMAGEADFEVRGGRAGFGEALYPALARELGIAVASPMLDLDAALAEGAGPVHGTLRILGLDALRAAQVQPALFADDPQRMFEFLKPDTVLLSPVHVAVAVSAYRNLPYDLEKDLTPITTVAVFPDVLVAATRVPARDLRELIAYAKANPGKVNCGSAGNGTTRHLACEMFNAAAGIKAEHVPYKGTGPATTALLGGEIDYIFEALGSASPHIRSGKLRPIAVTSAKRSPSFPDIPTAIESGLPGFDVTSWYGLWAPTGTPPAVVQRLHGLVNKAFEDPEMRELWFKLGAETGGIAPAAFGVFVRQEVQKWGKVVRDAGVVID